MECVAGLLQAAAQLVDLRLDLAGCRPGRNLEIEQ